LDLNKVPINDAGETSVADVYGRWGIDAAHPVTADTVKTMNNALSGIQQKLLQPRSRPNTPRKKSPALRARTLLSACDAPY